MAKRVHGPTRCLILGGGQGRRLYPLTAQRAKPAVPLAGKYRLIDVAVSNCLNSRLHQIYVLTQFNSVSLNRHVINTYRFDSFSGGFVQILAAEQTTDNMDWYQGTADAVRQNLRHLDLESAGTVVILSGDQLYRMDFRRMLSAHRAYDADITVAATPVRADAARRYGVLLSDAEGWIREFVEKPGDAETLDRLRVPPQAFEASGVEPGDRTHLASMGIYIFNPRVLEEALADESHSDFGSEVIPAAIGRHRVLAFVHDGYWEDIGTVESFYLANLALTDTVPAFNFFDEESPIYTNRRGLPSSKINACAMSHCVISEGCIIDESTLSRCVVGLRCVIGSGCDIRDSVLMGSDYYERMRTDRDSRGTGLPALGIGKDTIIRRAIVDKNARIGDGVRLVNESGVREASGENFVIVDGIIVIPRGAVVPSGTVV